MRSFVLVALSLTLAACGQKGDLQRAAGQPTPPPPYGRDQSPPTASLMTPPQQAVPRRNVELRTRSEPREDDPFDLPAQE